MPLLTRPEHIVHFFRDVHGVYPITKEALAKWTQEYQQWVEAYARNHCIPIEWPDAEPLKTKKLKKEDYVRPYGTRMERQRRFGVYFIFKSLEQGPFLWTADVQALQAVADRLDPEVIRQRLDYWTLVLGPKFSKKDRTAINLRRAYSLNQVELCRNVIFRRHFPIHRIFERSAEIGVFRLTPMSSPRSLASGKTSGSAANCTRCWRKSTTVTMSCASIARSTTRACSD